MGWLCAHSPSQSWQVHMSPSSLTNDTDLYIASQSTSKSQPTLLSMQESAASGFWQMLDEF